MTDYSQDHFNELYSEGERDPWKYFESEYEQQKYDRTLRWALDRKEPEAVTDILELGCGNGAFTEKLVSAFPNADILGVDISEEALDKARNAAPEADFICGDMFEVIQGLERKYDLIFASECLYYLTDMYTIQEFRDFVDLATNLLSNGYLLSANIHREPSEENSVEDRETMAILQTTLETSFDIVGQNTYTEKKRTEGRTREYEYQIWAFE
ncbi:MULTISPECIES: class I SAM-dependent methyltransferase [Halorubrum]|uniref:Type 11 methyltransferase n=1 Tax=Halorubrum hochstenium ATCC 700873 TaxID=1227481 RepID=M0FNJ9_9EURY|nr:MULTISPECIES: class I SAM-dependent methyltransferase [Halorubrum]ELZ61606.1 type 11 methyltransferase [Halorubrum hochstenium ATCC 700873]